MPTNHKQQLGQFFTENSDYILQGLESYVKGKVCCDPFAGGGDLLDWATRHGAAEVSGYDVDPAVCDGIKIKHNDSLQNPQQYDFVITNPPYLGKNKARDDTRKLFENNAYEDLYQISLDRILNSNEGIVIVPVNFLCSERAAKIRNRFFELFDIKAINYFTVQVFKDTTYNVIAFYYRRTRAKNRWSTRITLDIYPDQIRKPFTLRKEHGWAIGGEIASMISNQPNKLGIRRLMESEVEAGPFHTVLAHGHINKQSVVEVSGDFLTKVANNIMMLKAIDSGSKGGEIAIEDVGDYGCIGLLSKPTSRHMISLVFETPISVQEQKDLIQKFNRQLSIWREQYLSLFLTNFRDKNRKRISFDFVYKTLNWLYFNQGNENVRTSVQSS